MEPIRRQPLFSLSSPPSWHLSESTKYMKLQSELTRVETRKETWLKRKQLSEWERTDSNCQYKLFHDGKTNERTPARLPCPPNFLPNAPQTKCHLRGQKRNLGCDFRSHFLEVTQWKRGAETTEVQKHEKSISAFTAGFRRLSIRLRGIPRHPDTVCLILILHN